ncbi:hypothetical protein Tco_0511006 [Tanacetum coccineum]
MLNLRYKQKSKASMDALEKKIDDGIEKLDASIKAMKKEWDAKFEELKQLILGTAPSKLTHVDHVPQITKVAAKTAPYVPSIRRAYDDIGLELHNSNAESSTTTGKNLRPKKQPKVLTRIRRWIRKTATFDREDATTWVKTNFCSTGMWKSRQRVWDPGIHVASKILKNTIRQGVSVCGRIRNNYDEQKMAELKNDWIRELRAHSDKKVFVSLVMSIRAYRDSEQIKTRRRRISPDIKKNIIDKKTTDFRIIRTIQRSVYKEDKDEQRKEEKGVVNYFEVGTDEQDNSRSVLNDVGGIVYGKGNDTWDDAGLKHGSYLLLDVILEDGWYFLDESGLNKKPLCRSNLNVHLQFHVDRLETGSQVKTWDPGIKFVRSNTLRTRCFKGREY